MIGWIKLNRSLLDKGWYCKSEYLHLWIHLLLKANHAPKEIWIGGVNTIIETGQFITGRKKLSAETGISESKVQRILKCFETEQQIEQQTFTTNRLISILNWEKYQESEQPFEQQMNSERTAAEQRLNITKNDKNYKNIYTTTTSSSSRANPYESDQPIEQIKVPKKKTAFVAPELPEVTGYFLDLENTAEDAQKFFLYYTANGWKVGGKAAMKDWKAAAQSWTLRTNKNQPNASSSTTSSPAKFGRQSIDNLQRLAEERTLPGSV